MHKLRPKINDDDNRIIIHNRIIKLIYLSFSDRIWTGTCYLNISPHEYQLPDNFNVGRKQLGTELYKHHPGMLGIQKGKVLNTPTTK